MTRFCGVGCVRGRSCIHRDVLTKSTRRVWVFEGESLGFWFAEECSSVELLVLGFGFEFMCDQ